MAHQTKGPRRQPRALQHLRCSVCQRPGLRALTDRQACQPAQQPRPQRQAPPKALPRATRQHQRHQPQRQCQQVHAQRGHQRTAGVDAARVAQHGKHHAIGQQHHGHGQGRAQQPGGFVPARHLRRQPQALAQQPGALTQALLRRRLQPRGLGQGVGIVERAGLFDVAHGQRHPDLGQGRAGGLGGHAACPSASSGLG